ncbi:MAG: DUF1592 domain-containing protein [Bradymonadaceae bacterium]
MSFIGSTPRLRRVVAAVAVAGALAGCGYGRTSVWESPPDDDRSSATDSPVSDSEDLSADRRPARATACRVDGGRSAGPAPARLLTNYEYRYTVRDVLGYEGGAWKSLPAENEVNGFENNTAAHAASRRRVREFMKVAEKVARRTVDRRLDALLPCDPSNGRKRACGVEFIDSFLTEAFRRPPTDAEKSDFVGLFERTLDEADFETAVETVVAAALQSPQFLYRLEFVDGQASGAVERVDGWEMASRLSYFLWASAPDERLARAARNGELKTEAQVEAQARRMLDDPRAKRAVYQFHRQWMGLDELGSVVKDETRFPAFETSMTEDWRRSLKAYVTQQYQRDDADLESFLTSRRVYLTDRLKSLYDPSGPVRSDAGAGDGLTAYRFDGSERAGLLTQPALMALLANANQSSPVRRGVWIREQLLCQPLDPPPQDADTTPPDPDPNATTREKFRQHTADPQCAGCHRKIDPIGFGFTHYDALGRWRQREEGRRLDDSGRLVATRDPQLEGRFEGSVELAKRLEGSRQVSNCIASKWFTYALGRQPNDRERCSLYHVQQAFRESGGDFRELLVALVTSDAFRYRRISSGGSSK